ncbi:acyl-CoA dehydrogenase family protein [Egicoccus halophilus]|uniref:acyl-CoA oxidase n=1 Tax=Egicoccus halophilus TaxID=1670830 RepID=A0A8J3AFG7_9ACTN|nr:acyl-CoA dehydrogenase [Egicoccus halophilus]GGI06757.1 acyl-CoA oxidase [Egicoccus halophilus]
MSATSELPPLDGERVTAERVQAHLDGRWAEVRDRSREELRHPLLAPVHGLSLEEHRQRTMEQARHLAKSDGPGLLFPERYGGGDDLGGALTSFEMLAHGDLSLMVKAGVQWGLFGGAILNLGGEEHRSRYLPEVISLDLPGCFAMTETGHGSDVQSLRTTATYDPDTQEWVVHTPDEDARKDYIGNAARDGRMAAVFAQLITDGASHGVHCFLVPIRDEHGEAMPGVTIEDCGHKGGLNGVDNGRLRFEQVRVPRTNLLDRFGQVAEDGTYTSPIEQPSRRFFTMLGTLVTGRASVSGSALSATKTALTIAVRYAGVRRQFRSPDGEREAVLFDFRQHQRRLLPLLAKTYALHAAQQDLLERLHTSFADEEASGEMTDRQELEARAAGIKAATTWHATEAIQTSREACGGNGYLSENRLTQLKADTDVFTTFEGDNTVLLQLVAKGLLTDYRSEFGSMDTFGMARWVADQLVETVVERTAARQLWQSITGIVSRDEDTDLHDRAWQLQTFAWREQHVIAGVARRLKAGVDAGGDGFDVFNDVQDHVLLAARASVDRVVLESFAARIEACEDTEVAALLDRLCDLYALSVIEAERGWYLEHGRFDAQRSKAVTAAVNELCTQLRPFASVLVDAFAIPDEAVGAPIALGDEHARQAMRDAAG